MSIYTSPILDGIIIECSDETTDLVVANDLNTFRFLSLVACPIVLVGASVNEAPTGSPIICDLRVNSESILSTKIQIDIGVEHSKLSTVQPVVIESKRLILPFSEITPDLLQVGSGVKGRGLKVFFTWYRF